MKYDEKEYSFTQHLLFKWVEFAGWVEGKTRKAKDKFYYYLFAEWYDNSDLKNCIIVSLFSTLIITAILLVIIGYLAFKTIGALC